MKRKECAAALGILSAMILSGCSLAIPGAGAEGGEDRLIGAFITEDYPDLFDMEAYLQDHVSQFKNAGEIQIGNTVGYEQKLYAVIDKKGSENASDWDISFGELEGISFFAVNHESSEGAQTWDSVYSAGISDVSTDINVTDDSSELSLKGTIYIVPGQADKDIAYYMNPVFQTADGRIYLTGGSGFSTSGESGEESVYFTSTLDGEVRTTGNGKCKTEKSSVALSYATMYPPVGIALYQMDEAHQCLKKQEFVPGTLPESLKLEPGAAYLLTETEKERLSGERFFTRAVYDNREDAENIMKTWYESGNGILAGQETVLEWN